MSAATPDIAVVIPTRDRETRLRFALEALAAQTLPAERFEVVVVRATDSQPPYAEAPEGLPVRFLRAEEAGPAAQRNLGWRASAAPLVAFTDDDCRPAPEWLKELLAAAGKAADRVVLGRTQPDAAERHLLYGLARSIEIDELSDWFETCNIAYPRALLEATGGFDESFPSAWGEDTDLGLRAVAAGAEPRFVPGALVEHAVVERTLPAAIREARRREALALVLRRHPGQRAAIHRGVFANRAHARLALALAIAIGARRSRLAPLALAVYPGSALLEGVRRGPLRPRAVAAVLAHLPAAVLLDLAETIATVRGAVRHRTPVI